MLLPGSHSTCAQQTQTPTVAVVSSCCCSTIPSPHHESRFRVRCHRDPPRLRPRRRNQIHNSDRQMRRRRRRKLVLCLCCSDQPPTNRRTRPGHRSSGSQSRRPPCLVLDCEAASGTSIWPSSLAGRVGQSYDCLSARHLLCPCFFRDVILSSACIRPAKHGSAAACLLPCQRYVPPECSWPLGLFIRDDG